uniref:Integrase_H2C2 domain-containing protein n=1 Tax=Loa loa TaxID=7209 RepID=A0A1I7VGN6_LOALO
MESGDVLEDLERLCLELIPYFINRGKIAELIVKHYHEKLFYASVHYNWCKMKQRYWIPHGRSYIKKILRKVCKGCTMWVATPFGQPDFPPYPVARVVGMRPFETVGLDLFGPILIKEDHGKPKRWVALFTCLATRAMYLENRVQRKMKQWGGDSLLQAQGSVYERMVGVVKGSLGKDIGTKLNNGELITLVTELETIINERPLVDLEEIGLVLRPGDFLDPGSARGENLT